MNKNLSWPSQLTVTVHRWTTKCMGKQKKRVQTLAKVGVQKRPWMTFLEHIESFKRSRTLYDNHLKCLIRLVWYLCLTASSKCKCSSLRSQYWLRLFLWFSNTVHYDEEEEIILSRAFCKVVKITMASGHKTLLCLWCLLVFLSQ